jgi:hypothetical protein
MYCYSVSRGMKRTSEQIHHKIICMGGLQPSSRRDDLLGGLISAALSIPLAMGYGMFAFTALGDSYFAYGALAGLYAAIVVGIVCVVLGFRIEAACVKAAGRPRRVDSASTGDAPPGRTANTGHSRRANSRVLAVPTVGPSLLVH